MSELYKLKKFGDDQLAEMSYARFQEAKKRLRHFVINTDMVSNPKEKKRLLAFFKHRPHTLTTLLKECFKARKVANPAKFKTEEYVTDSGEIDGNQKAFKLFNKTPKASENLSQE
jgi:hypothetical protein